MTPRLPALLVAVAALVAGCGTPGGDSGDNTEKAEESKKNSAKVDVAKAGNVTLTIWDQEVRGGQKKQITQLNKDFQTTYPNVKIERVAKSFTDLNTTLKLAVSGPNAPDIVEANQGRQVMGALVKGGLLKPMDAYADAYGWNDRWSKTLLDLNRFSSDGKQFGSGDLYGVSQQGEIVGVFYNKDKVASMPKTFAEFEDMLAKAKADGEVPISFGNLDKFGGIHEFQAVQNAFASKDDDAQLRVREGRRELRHAREPRGGHEAPGVGRQGLLHAEHERHRLRRRLAGVHEGQGPVHDRRHLDHQRRVRRDGRQARLLPAAAPRGGQRAGRARR